MCLPRNLRYSRFVLFCSLLLTSFLLLTPFAMAQSQSLTVVVLVNSANTTGYNTSSTTPGTYQMGPEPRPSAGAL